MMRPIMRRLFGKQRPPSKDKMIEGTATDDEQHSEVATPSRRRWGSRSSSRSRSRSPGFELPQTTPPHSPEALTNGRMSSASVGCTPSIGRTSSGRCRRSLARRASQVGTRLSFVHRDFDNPEAETCWLSCLFQSLWHSVIFHTAFEEHLVASKHRPLEEEKILSALQQTWEEYKVEGGGMEASMTQRVASPPGYERLVSSDDLVEAFGEGYGDMSEALALMVDELSQSGNDAAVRIAEQIMLVPLTLIDDVFPTPDQAWKQVEEWQATKSPIIAVDLSLPRPSKDGSRRLSELWVPADYIPPVDAREGLLMSKTLFDMGPDHRLVSLVCFMHSAQHYVAFCRRQSDPSECVFFNDLPSLTAGAEKVVKWCDVPEMCGKYALTPRLVLYEATSPAEVALNDPGTSDLLS